ncbi:Tn3 family transposase [Micromonospora sp. NPDC005206]|uniref:Tn3 family transposase n=1 Tax=Micromonospora sp. NPDC005206 TaxID=3157022 RepID=UPI0033B06147
MPVEFLTDEQAAAYGRFPAGLTPTELEGLFFLDDADRDLIAERRRDENRIGFGLQVATVRALGLFLEDPLDVPTEAVDYVAVQVGAADPSVAKEYLRRRPTRFEHQREIAQAYGYTDFAGAEPDLTRWIDDRAWTTGDGPKALFNAAVGWLRERKVLLPAVSTLARLVARVRAQATDRLHQRLSDLVSAFQARLPEDLLETVDKAAYVFCVLEQFHQRLKRRDIFAAVSERWGDPRARLLDGEAWQQAKAPALNALQLPEEPRELLGGHAAALDEAWRQVAAGLAVDTAARLDDEGRLHAQKVTAVPDPSSLVDLRNRVEAMLPRIDLGELILEVMAWYPGFAGAFTALSGATTRLDDLHVTVAATLTAHALNVGFGPVISDGIPGLTRGRISHVDATYLRPETYAAANAVLIDVQDGIGLARAWGGGLVAAADGMRFVVPVRTIHARPNPKYFGQRRGATWLNAVNDQAVGTAGMVLSGTPRDSMHLIDLLYRRDGGRRPEVVIADTGSYSDVVFGLLQLLGFDYRPQLADLPDAKLWRINRTADYGPLNATARGIVDLDRIRRHWPDMLRIAGSIHTGQISAYDALRVLLTGGNLTQLGEALAGYGRIFKTLHVLTFVDDEPYRRQIKGMRNLNEGRHDLARHVFHGRRGELHRAYHEGLEDQLGALGLVLNCITLWNTLYLDLALAGLRAQGYPVLYADVARLSPYVRHHIRVHGHYTFTLPDLGGRTYRPLRDPDAGDDE